jgi:hypothetical protein
MNMLILGRKFKGFFLKGGKSTKLMCIQNVLLCRWNWVIPSPPIEMACFQSAVPPHNWTPGGPGPLGGVQIRGGGWYLAKHVPTHFFGAFECGLILDANSGGEAHRGGEVA